MGYLIYFVYFRALQLVGPCDVYILIIFLSVITYKCVIINVILNHLNQITDRVKTMAFSGT